MRLASAVLLLLACNHGPDPDELKLRDTTINGLKTLVAKAKSSVKDDREFARITAPHLCNKEHLDKVMKSKPLEQEILDECAKDLPQIESSSK